MKRSLSPRSLARPRSSCCAALVLVVWFASAVAFGSQIEALAHGKVRPSAVAGLREAYLPIIFPSSHAANLLSLRNGDLLCTYFSGSWEGESGVAIVLSRLPKGSNHWAQPTVPAQEMGWSLQNPVLFEPPRGPLWLLHTSQKADAGQSQARVFYLTSADGGYNWTHSKLLFDQPGAFIRQRLLVVGSRWFLPMYYTPSFGITGEAALRNYSVIQISGDQGNTWKACTVPDSNGLVQPDVVELAQNRFIAFFRSRFADWVYSSTSQDGCSWTTPVPTEIPNNNSSMQVERLKNGDLLIAFNNTQATTTRGGAKAAPRVPVSVALSLDGGQTWPWVRDVDTGDEVSRAPVPDAIAGIHLTPSEKRHFIASQNSYAYPSVIQTPDGAIHMAYTFRRRTIKYVSFDESWIKAGSTIGVFKGHRPH